MNVMIQMAQLVNYFLRRFCSTRILHALRHSNLQPTTPNNAPNAKQLNAHNSIITP